jgi:1-acyl-sn-glycerol-3-phosphate acyltransferase
MPYILSVLYYLNFFVLLFFFHPLQVFCHRVLGYKWQMRLVNCMNFFLYNNIRSLGAVPHFTGVHNVPHGVPIIFISNHQSIFDIIGFVWNLRQFHPKYISKKELATGIPSISYNLRHGGSVLIDRNDARQALTEIAKMGIYIETHKRSVVIFPEGTRTRTGAMLPFHNGGVAMLLKKSPSAVVVPVALRNLWKLEQHGQLQMPKPIGGHYYFDVLPPIDRTGKTADEIVRQAETAIHQVAMQP